MVVPIPRKNRENERLQGVFLEVFEGFVRQLVDVSTVWYYGCEIAFSRCAMVGSSDVRWVPIATTVMKDNWVKALTGTMNSYNLVDPRIGQ